MEKEKEKLEELKEKLAKYEKDLEEISSCTEVLSTGYCGWHGYSEEQLDWYNQKIPELQKQIKALEVENRV